MAPVRCARMPRQGLLWETSLLDAEEGIRFRGLSIPDLQVGQPCVYTGMQCW